MANNDQTKKKGGRWTSALKKVVSKEQHLWKSISSGFKWKPCSVQDFNYSFQMKIALDNLVFKVLYVVEALVLVSTLCFFFLCCGCHF